MKKVGSSLKKLGGLFLGLLILFLLFKMFSSSREGFTDHGCTVGSTSCDLSNKNKCCNGSGSYARLSYKCKEYKNNGRTTYGWGTGC